MSLKNILTVSIAFVWLINGLFCKVLNLVPRHQQIVSRILGEEHPVLLTKTIGLLEILMAVWIVSGIKSRLNAFVQIFIIAVMNIIEFIMVPELLLFGQVNIIIATLFILVIAFNQFILKRSTYAIKQIN
jgi:uncharacterized membrane protein YphA (DoxX/SURF4 family)